MEVFMFIVKGLLLGAGLFIIGLIVYTVAYVRTLKFPEPVPGQQVGVDLVTLYQHNPWLLVALIACLALGISIIASWPTRGIPV